MTLPIYSVRKGATARRFLKSLRLRCGASVKRLCPDNVDPYILNISVDYFRFESLIPWRISEIILLNFSRVIVVCIWREVVFLRNPVTPATFMTVAGMLVLAAGPGEGLKIYGLWP